MYKEFIKDAERHGKDLQNSNATFIKEIEKLTQQLQEIHAKQEKLPMQIKRAKDYAELKNKHACPRCYVENGNISEVISLAGDDSSDNFRCKICGYEVSVFFR